MGVLIRDMNIPKDKQIFLSIDEKGQVYIYGEYPTKIYKAIEVPNVRLIDADELYKCAVLRSEQFNGYFNDLDNVINARYIKTFPTIIQAEEGE